MKIWYRTEDINLDPGQKHALIMGNFDGLHLGHRYMINLLKEAAAANNLSTVVVTFDPHPAYVHRPSSGFAPIMSLQQRLAALEECGVEAVLVIPYSLKFAQQTPEEFVKNVFVDVLNTQLVVAGHDIRFGINNSGDQQILKELGEKYGFVVKITDLKKRGEDGLSHSSTLIRQFLREGDIPQVNRVLGRNHALCGEVIRGCARGRQLGFPTANLQHDLCGYIPADGIYAGWLLEDDQRHPAAISVGVNPTFEVLEQRQVEAYVMNRPSGEAVENFNLYGKNVCLEFVARLREMIAYSGQQALVEQMRKDIENAWRILRNDARA